MAEQQEDIEDRLAFQTVFFLRLPEWWAGASKQAGPPYVTHVSRTHTGGQPIKNG